MVSTPASARNAGDPWFDSGFSLVPPRRCIWYCRPNIFYEIFKMVANYKHCTACLSYRDNTTQFYSS